MQVNRKKQKSLVFSKEINNTYSRQLSIVYLFGITSPRLTWEWIKNHMYVCMYVFEKDVEIIIIIGFPMTRKTQIIAPYSYDNTTT